MPSRDVFLSSFLLFFALLFPLVVAHAEDVVSPDEEAGLSHQFAETVPHHHFAQGHVFAGITLLVLWMSLFYAIYNLIHMLQKRKQKNKRGSSQ